MHHKFIAVSKGTSLALLPYQLIKPQAKLALDPWALKKTAMNFKVRA